MSCKKKNTLRSAAAETTHTAAEHSTHAIDEALAALAPLVANLSEHAHKAGDAAAPYAATAKDKVAPFASAAKEKVTPYATTAKDRVAPYAATAKDKVGPLAASARDRLAPYASAAKENAVPLAVTALAAAKEKAVPLAHSAVEHGVEFAHDARTKLEPALHDAVDRAQPHLDSARARVQDDLVPRLTDLLQQATEHPAVVEADKRSHATVAALKGDLVLPDSGEIEKKGGFVRRAAKVMAAGALLAAAAVAVRQFLGSKDDGWAAHEPSRGYVPQDAESASDAAPVQAADLVESPVEDETTAEAVMTDEGGPVADDVETTAGSDEAPAVSAGYGEGSYVGDNPPAEYPIKGNERSMKYHVPESGGYERTIADVWFVSPEAAEAAGFTRAQR